MPTIDQLEAEISALDARRQVVLGLLQALRAYEGSAVVPANRMFGPTRNQERVPRAGSAMAETDRVASELMEKTGKPVHTGAIASRMHTLGHSLPEKNARNIVSARMSNNPRFSGRRGEGWWFADRPWPDENDDPRKPISDAENTSSTDHDPLSMFN